MGRSQNVYNARQVLAPDQPTNRSRAGVRERFVAMVGSTLFACSLPSTSSSVDRWIEENSGLNELVSQARAASGSRRCRVSNWTRSSGRCVSASGISEFDEASGQWKCRAQLGSQPWVLLPDGVGGWLLGLAMAGLIAAGELAPSESQAAALAPRSGYDPVSEEEREASSAFSRRVTEALELLDKARKAQASEDFSEALRCYSLVRYHHLNETLVVDWLTKAGGAKN
jgi:hypothetical protein